MSRLAHVTARYSLLPRSAEADRLAREYGVVESDLEQDWSLLAEELLSDTLTCPLCQAAAAQLSADGRLSCRCGLAVRAPCAEPQRACEQLIQKKNTNT